MFNDTIFDGSEIRIVGPSTCVSAEEIVLVLLGNLSRRGSIVGRLRGLLLLCAFVCAAFSSPAMASEYHGQVTFNGQPVPGAKVTATRDGKNVSTVSDTQGVYSFADLSDGTWTVQIDMTGFSPLHQEITVPPVGPVSPSQLKLMSLDQIRSSAKVVKAEAAPAVSATTVTPEAKPASAKLAGPLRPGRRLRLLRRLPRRTKTRSAPPMVFLSMAASTMLQPRSSHLRRPSAITVMAAARSITAA